MGDNVYPDEGSPTGYSDIYGSMVDSTGQPVSYDSSGQLIDSNGGVIGHTPAADTNNVNNKSEIPGTVDNIFNPGSTDSTSPDLLKQFNDRFGTALTGAQLAKVAAIGAGGVAGLMGANKSTVTPVGYQGGIPQLQANRNMMTAPPAGHRPGSGGINWGGDVTYSPKGTPAAAAGGSYTPPAGISGLMVPSAGRDMYDQRTYEGYAASNKANADASARASRSMTNDVNVNEPLMSRSEWEASRQPQSGITAAFARGGSTGEYLQGDTDGMADELPTTIDGKQPAALSHGEFVIPADVVSHLGNGNSDAGAKKLYSMMDKIREARTGTKKQGKQINPDKFMPGGAVGYSAGGIASFATGGTIDPTASAAAAGVTGTEQGLSNWVGPYATDMLAKGQALSDAPYQQYQGPLTAGASDLQNQAFDTAGNLSTPTGVSSAMQTAGDIANRSANISYTPTTSNFTADQAQQYMNPYLKASLDPQLAEARRQSDITATQNAAKMTSAGAFGGGRQAILDAENQRNLGTNLANITGQGYNTAYTNAMSQFNADQNRNMSQNQFGANLGLQGLQTGNQAAQTQGNLGISSGNLGLQQLQEQAALGAQQRGIESEGLAADQAAFNAARDNPYKMVQFQQSLLNGLPITATNYNMAQPSAFQSFVGGASTTADLLKKLGIV